ncbi:MAG TPA: DUF2288 domain-containing protein [Verrucomicrobiae bacterium]|nr:DUF2288 domain-containing protein [Verrucomicrobiae bacterium]
MISSETLAVQVDVAEWGWLRPHLERGGLVLVAADLDLAEVGARMAADDAQYLQGLISAGKVGKPSAAQVADWDTRTGKQFRMLVISPWVLVQESGIH